MKSLEIAEITGNLNLENINLSQNAIKSINQPGVLRNHSKLKSLILDSNTNLNGNGNAVLLENQFLEFLSCKMCGFSGIFEKTLAGLPNLRVLSLKLNKIENIDGNCFKNNIQLESLELSYNRIQELTPNLIINLKALRSLQLNNNPIKMDNKKQTFLKSSSLKIIECNYCRIQRVYDNSFNELTSLECLSLNHNFIELLPENAFKLNGNLKTLLMEHNKLKKFPNKIIDYLLNLRELCLDDNDFTIDFDMQILIEKYNNRTLRSEICQNQNIQDFFELKYKSDEFIEESSMHAGISDLFIGSYLTIIMIIQAILFALLSIYLIKIVKYENFDGDMDYSATILNDNDIYKVYRSRD